MPLEEGQKEPLQKLTKILNSIMARPEAGPFLEPVDWRGLELFEYPEIVKHPMDLGTIKRKLERRQYSNTAECARDIRLVWTNCMLFNAERSDFWTLAKSLSKRFEDRYRKVTAEHDVGEAPVDEDEDADDEDEDADNAAVAVAVADQEDNGRDEDEDDDDEENELQDDDDEEDDEELAAGSDLSPASSKARSETNSNAAVTNLDAKARFATNLLMLNGQELGHVITQLEIHCPQALQVSKDVADRMEIMFDEIKDTAIFQKLSAYANDKVMAQKRLMPTVMPIHDISRKRKR